MTRRDLIATLLLCLGLTACAPTQPSSTMSMGPEWESAISYSGYREGQDPAEGIYPSQAEVLEDLRILETNWTLIRTYATDQHSRDMLEVIRREGIDLKVMLGAYFAEEPGGEAENDKQIEDCIELANAYPEIVVAVNVGNEALIDWSLLPVPEARVMEYVRRVKAGVSVPVTVADNYVYWRDHGAAMAELVDFVTVHTYPIWERKDIDEGLSYTIQTIDEVRQALPGKPIVIGEAGWASFAVGNQHIPRAGTEEKQRRHFRELTEWGREQGIPIFWFSAFDEPWKGTGTEGHWGLFDVHRNAKLAMHELYPERVVDEPTSPEYTEADLRYGPPIAALFDPALAPKVGGGGVNVSAGWDDVVVVAESDDAASGDSSLKMTHNGKDWGGFYVMLSEPFDTTDYSRMSVSVKLPADVVELEIRLESPGGRGSSVELSRFERSELAGGWAEHSVSLEAFEAIDPGELVILGFWHPRNARGELVASDVLIDGIRFE